MLAALNMTASILKLRIGSFIALAALVGILTSEGELRMLEALVFALAVLGASGAAGGFNQYYERESDKRMARTRNRPFASGLLKAGPIWPVTLLAVLIASLLMAWSVGGTLATVLVFLGALT
ncbi:MAG: UbiA family prenyltransferase, partial [Sedimentitalea sp.]|nr:UbiA family prenyltransferase [Sedimentitalea sp.]